jgi:hypothetical protein
MQNSAHTKRERGGANFAPGHCLCKAVQYEVHGPLRSVIYCHCGMCRRTSGHFVAATACARDHLHIVAADALRWYPSSPAARRGFCQICGSNLFWEPVSGTHVSIMAGTLDLPTGLVASAHIFVAEAGDYYQILDGLPQSAGGRHSVLQSS